MLFQLTGDRCSQLDEFRAGDQVRLDVSLRGRAWKSPSGEVKYFTSLDVWKIEPARVAAGGRRCGRDANPRDSDGLPPRESDPRPGDARVDDIPR